MTNKVSFCVGSISAAHSGTVEPTFGPSRTKTSVKILRIIVASDFNRVVRRKMRNVGMDEIDHYSRNNFYRNEGYFMSIVCKLLSIYALNLKFTIHA